MSNTITKVALAGANGNLGPAVLNALLESKFQVTVLTREGSTHQFPASVTVSRVDYESVDSLTEALKGNHAVISTLGSLAVATQLKLVTAAVKAGIKRFIPSEFGSNLLNEKTRALPVYKDKIVVQDALKEEAAKADGFTYTFIYNGPFLDWGLKVGFIFNLKGKSVDLYDGGDRPFSTTTLETVGKAVASVLSHLEETKNRSVLIQDTAVSLKQLLEIAQKETGGPEGWTVKESKIDDILAGAWTELKQEKPDPQKFVFPFLQAGIWGEGYGSHYVENDNEVLGLKGLSENELQELVNGLAK